MFLHVAIIGNGIAGVTTAIRLRENCPDWDITMISGETDHHYSRPALMYIFMGHMRYEDTKPYEDRFWEKHRIDLMRAWVTEIDTEKKLLHFGGQTQPLGYDKLVIASGSESNKFGWPGQDLGGVQGLYNIQDLELLYKNIQDIKQAVIVGGGLIGIELGEMLHARNVPVTFLIREVNFWDNVLPKEEAMMVNRIIEEDHLGLVRETELKEIHDDGNGRVGAVTTSTGERIECQFVGLTAGVHPNIGFLKESGIPTGRGVLVDWSLRSEVPDVFAVGD
ncbi:MAG: FAD-dependent oxidoreductase, partial [Candidatus Eisenbacteria bacterium]|nr:FAD-dependent oxidoreductase [Candidatus Eisenbacteria bacterium]